MSHQLSAAKIYLGVAIAQEQGETFNALLHPKGYRLEITSDPRMNALKARDLLAEYSDRKEREAK